jgi:antitoxin ParD1/3/4
MNVSLTPELAEFVRGCVASGGYLTASEVVREALRRLRREQDERAALVDEVRERIETAYRSSLDGVVLDGDRVVERARRRIREREEPQATDSG